MVESGELIRVLEADRLGRYETGGPLPELVILSSHVLYEVVYDHAGTLAGARRITSPDVIQDSRAASEPLHQ